MFCKKTTRISLVCAVGLFLLIAGVLPPGAVRAEVVVIANTSVSVDSVSSEDLKKIFTGKLVVWNDGHSIKPAILADGQTHQTFIRNYIGKTTDQFRTYWRRMIFTGQGIQPRTFSKVSDLIEYVTETPGAVGYISASDSTLNTKTLSVSEK